MYFAKLIHVSALKLLLVLLKSSYQKRLTKLFRKLPYRNKFS